jgi:hypothetical protein
LQETKVQPPGCVTSTHTLMWTGAQEECDDSAEEADDSAEGEDIVEQKSPQGPSFSPASTEFAAWLQQNGVLEDVFGPRVHVELIKRVEPLLHQAIVAGAISMDVIRAVVGLALDGHETISKATFACFAKHVCKLPSEHLLALYKDLTQCLQQDSAPRRARLYRAVVEAVLARQLRTPEDCFSTYLDLFADVPVCMKDAQPGSSLPESFAQLVLAIPSPTRAMVIAVQLCLPAVGTTCFGAVRALSLLLQGIAHTALPGKDAVVAEVVQLLQASDILQNLVNTLAACELSALPLHLELLQHLCAMAACGWTASFDCVSK